MKPWIAIMAVVTTIGLYGCSQSPTAASLGAEPNDGVHASASDSVSAAPSVEQTVLSEAEAEAATADQQVGEPVSGPPAVGQDSPSEAAAPTARQRVSTAVATARQEVEAVEAVEVTDESLATEEAGMTAEAEAAAAQAINESNYLRILADLERQIGAADGA